VSTAPRDRLSVDLRRTALRIGIQTAGLLMTCLILVGAVLYLVVVRSQDQQMTQSLTNAVSVAGLGNDTDHDHDLSQPRGGIQYAVLDHRGLRVSADMPPGAPDVDVMRQVASSHRPDRRIVHLASGSYDVLTTQRRDDTVQLFASRYEQHQERERILGALAVAGGAGLVVATVAAAILARRAVRPIAQALELQRRFVADAGHELRTPLTLLSTRTQMLARRVRSHDIPIEERERLITRDADGIVADTASLTSILEELLIAADVRTPVALEPVDLATLAASAVASAQAAAHEADVTLTVSHDDAPSTVVAGTPSALARAIAALIDNALEHAAERVDVHVGRNGRWVVVAVVDDGPGIADETLPRMFDRFSSDRAPAVRPGERRHFGLGLALVSEIASRHGGTVTAENRRLPQTGAVLRLAMPALPAATAALPR
jgi:signal transduction histidine kinase